MKCIKSAFIALILVLPLLVSGQDEIDLEKRVNFGFNFGLNHSKLYSRDALPGNTEITNGFGFNLGILMDYSITEKLAISPKAELAYYNATFNSKGIDQSTFKYEIYPYSLNLMSHFVYKIGHEKVVPYILIGPNFKLPIANKADSNGDFDTGYDVAFDFGIGLENLFKHFNFAPELKYSYGILNISENPGIKTLNFHSVSLGISFKEL